MNWINIISFIAAIFGIISFGFLILEKFTHYRKYFLGTLWFSLGMFAGILSTGLTGGIESFQLYEKILLIKLVVYVGVAYIFLIFIYKFINDKNLKIGVSFVVIIMSFSSIGTFLATSEGESTMKKEDFVILVDEYEKRNEIDDAIRILEEFVRLSEVKKDKEILDNVKEKIIELKKKNLPF